MSSRLLIRLFIAVIMLTPALPAVTLAQSDGDVIVIEDNFDDPAAGVLQEGSDDEDLRFDYDDEGYEIDAFADDFAGDLIVPVPGEFAEWHDRHRRVAHRRQRFERPLSLPRLPGAR